MNLDVLQALTTALWLQHAVQACPPSRPRTPSRSSAAAQAVAHSETHSSICKAVVMSTRDFCAHSRGTRTTRGVLLVLTAQKVFRCRNGFQVFLIVLFLHVLDERIRHLCSKERALTTDLLVTCSAKAQKYQRSSNTQFSRGRSSYVPTLGREPVQHCIS